MDKSRPNDDCEFVAGVLHRAVCEAPFWQTVLWRVRKDHGINYDPAHMQRVVCFLGQEIYCRMDTFTPWNERFDTMTPEEQMLIDPEDMTLGNPTPNGAMAAMTPAKAELAACRLVAYAATGIQRAGRAAQLLDDESLTDGDSD